MALLFNLHRVSRIVNFKGMRRLLMGECWQRVCTFLFYSISFANFNQCMLRFGVENALVAVSSNIME